MSYQRRSCATSLFLAAAISSAALRARALTPGGAVAATIVGGTVYAGAGWRGSAALIAYFLSSTLLGLLPSTPSRTQRRGNQRDAIQVLANGGVPAFFALVVAAHPDAPRHVASAGFSGAVAAATADTWSTEIGTRFGGMPRSIATLQRLPTGSSGGVSATGFAASIAGTTLIAAITAGSHPSIEDPRLAGAHWPATALGGIAGSLADSFFGATVQAVRICDACEEETELPVHGCGTPTRHLRGLRWCDNDAVNALAIAIGALTSMAIMSSIGHYQPRWNARHRGAPDAANLSRHVTRKAS